MTTPELAERLAEALGLGERQQLELYRSLLLFNIQRTAGYVGDGLRGQHQRFAAANGFFWLPCVICGQWRGGHEPMAIIALNVHEDLAHVVCWECAGEAQRINELFPEGIAH